MTRIISGTARGRQLKVPKSGTRPTSDRVRESVFNLLSHRIDWEGIRVLDLYAGSGAFALESMSRGAASAVAVEQSRTAAETIRANSEATGLKVQVVQADAEAYVRKPQPPFDLVFIDPPYEVEQQTIEKLLSDAVAAGLIVAGTFVVIERSARNSGLIAPAGVESDEERRYGETSVRLLGW